MPDLRRLQAPRFMPTPVWLEWVQYMVENEQARLAYDQDQAFAEQMDKSIDVRAA